MTVASSKSQVGSHTSRGHSDWPLILHKHCHTAWQNRLLSHFAFLLFLLLHGKMTANPAEDVQDLDLGDEPYESAEDEDFQLDDVHSESASEGEEPEPAKKRKAEAREEGAGEVDSGDEETIQKAKKRRKGKKAKTKGGADEVEDVDFDDEGGPGGFVRTRAMKAQM